MMTKGYNKNMAPKSLAVGCHECGTSIIVSVPSDWSVNLVGILQMKHDPCGTVCDIGQDQLWVDKEVENRMAKDMQETILSEKLLTTVQEAIDKQDNNGKI